MVAEVKDIMQQDSAERRYLPRWSTNLRALWRKLGDRQVRDGTIKNLGCAGACLTGDAVASPDESILLTIELPWESPIRVRGTVCWRKEEGGQRTIGIRFQNTDANVQDLILRHMLETEHVKLGDFWFKDWK